MARFDERATRPVRGPGDSLRWKLGKKEPRPEGFAARACAAALTSPISGKAVT
jgi:hypothetical protein